MQGGSSCRPEPFGPHIDVVEHSDRDERHGRGTTRRSFFFDGFSDGRRESVKTHRRIGEEPGDSEAALGEFRAGFCGEWSFPTIWGRNAAQRAESVIRIKLEAEAPPGAGVEGEGAAKADSGAAAVSVGGDGGRPGGAVTARGARGGRAAP